MTETIEIEVTGSLREQYDALCEEHGEAAVQADLLSTIIGPINEGHSQLD